MLVTKAYGMLLLFNIFTALLYLCRTVLAMSEMSVRLSVRPSVKRVNCEKNERNVCQNCYTLRYIHVVF